jgi:RNA polymerase sigma-70 factor (ECF subfamily)
VDVERRLVESARDGDQVAFSQIAISLSPRLFTVAYRILRDYHRAEDVAQQALVLVWRDLPRLADVERFDGWAYRIVVNACYAELRRSRRRDHDLRPSGGVIEPADTDDTLSVDDRDALERGFDRLTPEHRAVLVLTYYLGLDQARIAEILGIPVGTVKSRCASARQAMRAALEAETRGDVRWRTA